MMEKIAIGASIDLVIIIGSTIMLFMICGFIYTGDVHLVSGPFL